MNRPLALAGVWGGGGGTSFRVECSGKEEGGGSLGEGVIGIGKCGGGGWV